MVESQLDSRAILLAIRRGLLTKEQAEAMDVSHETTEVRYGPRLDRLVSIGILSEEMVLSLLAELATDADTRSRSTPSASTSERGLTSSNPSVLDTLPAVFAQWERFEIKGSLGQGGMGVVYEALDKKLGRTVALKFIQRKNDRAKRRFLREARAQARVLHPHVCRVYDVGEFAGQPFVAMEYLRGEPLLRVTQRMSVDQKAQVIKTLALALQAAHRLGIVHRDVKPGNVMVEEREDGGLHATIMDFGLARGTVDDEDLTATGTVLGTPAYMSPEQARGEVVDRRADVYGLGAVLYHLLVGRQPFDGTNVQQVLLRVVHDEPTPIRKVAPRVPGDLEHIVMKCLSKLPQERYDSAQALAEDLERYLSGEPIRARQISWWRRAKPFMRKRGGILSIALSSVLALSGSFYLEARGQRLAERRAQLSQRFGREVESFDMHLRTAYLLPLHDVRQEEGALRMRMDRIANELVALKGLEAALAHSALGRAHLSMREYEAAREHLTAAIADGIDDGDTHAALGRTLGELYRRAREAVESEGSASMQPDRMRAIEAQWLVPAKNHLRRAIAMSSIERPFEEALLALYSRRYDDAQQKAEKALAERGWLYEAKKIAGDAHFARGFEHKLRGELEAASKEYVIAEQLYSEASEMARSDASLHAAVANVWLEQMGLAMLAGRSPSPAIEHVQRACDHALRADARWVEVFDTLYRAFRTHAYFEMERGGQPTKWFEKMYTSGLELQKLRPKDARPYNLMAQAGLLRLSYEIRRGTFNQGLFDEVERNAGRGMEINAQSVETWVTIGHVHQIAALGRMLRDEDARTRFEAAIAAFERVIALDPSDPHAAYPAAARTYLELLQHEHRRGRSIDAIVPEALRLVDRAIVLNATDGSPYRLRAAMRLTQAELAVAEGHAADRILDAVHEDLSHVLQGSTNDAEAHRLLAAMHRLRAESMFEQGADPLFEIAAAQADYERAIAIDAHNPENDVEAVRLLLVRARFADAKHEKERMAAAALVIVDKAMQRTPLTASTLHLLKSEAERLAGTTISAPRP